MSTAQEKLQAQASSLRKKLADAEAVADQLRAKLAILEARLTGGPVPLCGLEILWQTALPKSRERSSKHRCRTAWNRIPKSERPRVEEMISALKAWNRCDSWKQDNHLYAPGLHRFIQDRMWENLPEQEKARSLYRSRPARTQEPVAAGDLITPEEMIAILGLKPKQENALQ